MNTMIGVIFVTLALLGIIALVMLVFTVQYLRAGTRAFNRYVDMTSDPVGRVAPIPPVVPPAGGTTEYTGHRRPTSWGR